MDKRYWLLFVLLAWLTVSPTSHAGKVTYVYTDPQGTTLAEADASGNIVSTSDYRPYGLQVLGSDEDGPGYTGHIFDRDTNMVYMQARYYDPEIGRFVSTDPAGVGITNTFNFGRYVYVDNDPYGHIDPDGREAACVSSAGHCGDFAKGLPAPAIQSGLGAASSALNDLNENVVIPLIGANPAIGEEISVVLRGAADALEAASISGRTAETTVKMAGDLHAPGDVPDATVIVRGGTSDVPAPGSTFSGSQGATVEDAAKGVPHGQIRTSTAGDIRAGGGQVDVIPEPTPSGQGINGQHVNVTEGGNSTTFGPLQSNPVPKSERVR